ncbi:MAG: hypothetical protein MI976_00965, partial [Pseudomonadales bacterium]|nr:hypothetical protein [Pseudomonadales bacterium]
MSTVVEPSDVVSSVASPAADSDKAKGSNSAEGGAVEHVKQYHLRTKHRFSGYAKGPETLDWDDQPNPFRYFNNAESIELPFVEWSQEPAFSQLDSKGAGDAAPQPLTLETISWFLGHSLGLTGWKQFGPDKWSLRINPSSGNLHPTDAYLLLGNASQDLSDGMSGGLYSFNV